MSVTYATMRARLDAIIEDPDLMALTTSATGNTDKTTLIDASLGRFTDSYLNDMRVWLITATEERTIKSFMHTSGTVEFYEAVTAQIASAATYKLWKYSNAIKLAQINLALIDSYPRFYNPVKDETLFGQNSYQVPDEEYNRFIYAIPSGFEGYPDEIWIKQAYIGQHTGSDGAAALTDANANWQVSELVGLTVYNKTDGSSITITANTATTITGTLNGGTDDDWDEDDEYIVQDPAYKPVRLTEYTIMDPAASTKRFYADIGEDKLISLIGKGRLTEFTTETSTTELSNSQASILCKRAAANVYRVMASKVDTKQRDKFVMLALEMEALYEGNSRDIAMPSLGRPVLDYSWTEGEET